MNQNPAIGRSVAALMGRRMSQAESHLILAYPSRTWSDRPEPPADGGRGR